MATRRPVPPAERLLTLARFFREALAGSLDDTQRADYEERVRRAMAELWGERPKERRALVYDAVRLFSWGNESYRGKRVEPTAEQIDRRVEQVLAWVARVDAALAAKLEALALPDVRAALVAFAHVGGKGNKSTKNRATAMQALLGKVGLTASMRQIRRRAPRAKP